MAKKWEYCEIFIWRYNNEDFYRWRNDEKSLSGAGFKSPTEVLNQFGNQGWELVNTTKGYNTFKRELANN